MTVRIELSFDDPTPVEVQGLLALFTWIGHPIPNAREKVCPVVNEARELASASLPPEVKLFEIGSADLDVADHLGLPPHSEVPPTVEPVDYDAQGIDPEPAPEVPKRKRRTKAEMEAAKEPVDPPQVTSAPAPTAGSAMASAPASTPGRIGFEPPTLTSLREAMQSYADRLTELHGSDKAIEMGLGLLKSFNCNRVAEIAKLDEATQFKFLEACNG